MKLKALNVLTKIFLGKKYSIELLNGKGQTTVVHSQWACARVFRIVKVFVIVDGQMSDKAAYPERSSASKSKGCCGHVFQRQQDSARQLCCKARTENAPVWVGLDFLLCILENNRA